VRQWGNVGIPARDDADIFVGCRQDVGTMSAAAAPFVGDR